jgi:hypothetical protein
MTSDAVRRDFNYDPDKDMCLIQEPRNLNLVGAYVNKEEHEMRG